jgi:hypothetical protein
MQTVNAFLLDTELENIALVDHQQRLSGTGDRRLLGNVECLPGRDPGHRICPHLPRSDVRSSL